MLFLIPVERASAAVVLVDDFAGNRMGTRTVTLYPPAGTSTTPQASFTESGGVATMVMGGAGNGSAGVTLTYDFASYDMTSGGTNTQFFLDFPQISRPNAPSPSDTAVSISIAARDSSNVTGSYNVGVPSVSDFNIVLNFDCSAGGVCFTPMPNFQSITHIEVSIMFPTNYTASNDTTTVVLDTLWTTPTGGAFPPPPEADIAVVGSNPHYDSPIDFTVTFSSGPVYGFDVNDVTVGGTAPGTKTATVTGSSPVYNVRVSGMTGPGTVTVQVRSGAITDDWSQANTQTVTSPAAQYVVSSPPAFTSANTTTFQLLQPNSFSVTASGVPAPTFSLQSGTLPTGVTLDANGTLHGTPETGGQFDLVFRATNFRGSVDQTFTLQVDGTPVIDDTTPPPSPAVVGTPYSHTFSVMAYPAATFSVSSGTLPPGLTLDSNGVLHGTPTTPNTYSGIQVRATNTGGSDDSAAFSIAVTCPTLTVSPATLLDSSLGTAYSQAMSTASLTGMYTYAVTAGALPDGLSLTTDGTLSGTPTVFGMHNFTVTSTHDSTCTGSRAYTLNVVPVITVSPSALPNGTAGTSYSQTLTASGGAAPYSYAVTAGALPAGLSLASDGTISGTPTEAGSFGFTVTATDASTPTGYTGSTAVTLVIDLPTVTLAPATLTSATAATAYSVSITALGGISPYSYAVTAGALPAGLSLASDGTLSGTPTEAGTFNFTVTATDSTTGTGPATGGRAYSLTVALPTLAITPASLPSGTAGTAYNQTLSASGGIVPYSFAVTAGVLPAGLSLAADGTLSGTPTEADTFNFTVTVSDSTGGSGPSTQNVPYTLTIASPSLTVAPGSLPNGTAGTSYSQTLTASGGIAPYSYAVTAGSLPGGLTLSSGGILAGVPTASGTFNFTVTATDSTGGTAGSGSQGYSLTIQLPTLVLAPAAVPGGTAGTAYSQVITASGGTVPYTYSLSAGALPNGVTLASDGTISGTPTEAGSFGFTVAVADATTGTGPASATQSYTLVVGLPTLTLNPLTLANGAAGGVYAETFTAGGGIAPYSYSLTAGALPAGLTLGSGGALSGTPTASGTFNFTITATDSTGGTGPATTNHAYTLVIDVPTITLSPSTLSGGTGGQPYTQNISASGGIAPYSYSLTAGALPAGLTLGSGGTLSGTPTVSGSFNFTVTATDSTGGTPGSGSQAYTLIVSAPAIDIQPSTVPDGVSGFAYAPQTLTASGGVAPYTFSVTGGALPAGFQVSVGGVLSGTSAANGSFNFTVQAEDAYGFTGTRNYTLTLNLPVLTLSPASVPSGMAGVPYAQSFSGTGGVGPYAYNLDSGTLPVGLTFDPASATLSGTTLDLGSFTFTISMTDTGTSATTSQSYTLDISLVNLSLVPATATAYFNHGYTQALGTVGGAVPLTYSLTGGTLPPGLALDALAGTISGTPLKTGMYTFTVLVTDAASTTASANYTINVVEYAESTVSEPEGEHPNWPEPPPEAPVCTDYNFEANGVVRAGLPQSYGYGVYCHLLVSNRNYMSWYGVQISNSGNIGVTSVLYDGVIQAVDVFSPVGMTSFEPGAMICLRGSGSMIFLAQKQAPRVPQVLSTYTVDEYFPGFTCTTIYEPGILVLVEALPDDTAQTEGADVLSDCDVTTFYVVNLRAEPGLDGEVLAELPNSHTYPALDYVPGWYRISVDSVEGWVSDAYVNVEDGCSIQ
jgi:hypothetical protein